MTAFIPFVTAVAGTYPTLPAAAVLYSATLLVVNVDGYWLVLHLRRIGAYGEPAPPSVEAAMRRIRHGMAIRVVGLVAAIFLPVVSYAIFLIGTLYCARRRHRHPQVTAQTARIAAQHQFVIAGSTYRGKYVS